VRLSALRARALKRSHVPTRRPLSWGWRWRTASRCSRTCRAYTNAYRWGPIGGGIALILRAGGYRPVGLGCAAPRAASPARGACHQLRPAERARSRGRRALRCKHAVRERRPGIRQLDGGTRARAGRVTCPSVTRAGSSTATARSSPTAPSTRSTPSRLVGRARTWRRTSRARRRQSPTTARRPWCAAPALTSQRSRLSPRSCRTRPRSPTLPAGAVTGCSASCGQSARRTRCGAVQVGHSRPPPARQASTQRCWCPYDWSGPTCSVHRGLTCTVDVSGALSRTHPAVSSPRCSSQTRQVALARRNRLRWPPGTRTTDGSLTATLRAVSSLLDRYKRALLLRPDVSAQTVKMTVACQLPANAATEGYFDMQNLTALGWTTEPPQLAYWALDISKVRHPLHPRGRRHR
jgi:hypothetical protein